MQWGYVCRCSSQEISADALSIMSSYVSTHPVLPSLCLATMCYRQTLQLVPDIKSRVSHGEEGGRMEEEEEDKRGVSEDTLPGLVQSFHALSLDTVCEPKSPSRVSPPQPAGTVWCYPEVTLALYIGGAHLHPASRGPALYSHAGGWCLPNWT